MTETTRIENKAILTPELDIEKEVIAFLNYKGGGCIYIGVDKNGQTLGVDDVDDCMLRLKDRIKNNISPSAMGLFDFTENFIRLTLPISHPHSGDQIETYVTPHNNDIDSIVEKLGKKLGEKLGKKIG